MRQVPRYLHFSADARRDQVYRPRTVLSTDFGRSLATLTHLSLLTARALRSLLRSPDGGPHRSDRNFRSDGQGLRLVCDKGRQVENDSKAEEEGEVPDQVLLC